MARTGVLAPVGLILTAGSIVMLFFIILSGLSKTTPLSKTYFLQADTHDYPGARNITQWTYFFFCDEGNKDCSKAHAAPAFGAAWGAGAKDVPEALIGSYGGGTTSKKFYYLWRFGWVLLLITLFFEVLTFFSSFLACFGRLGSAVSGILSGLALFCFSAAASITTATFVSAQKEFKKAGRDAHLGKYGLGFLWGAYAALLISQILFCMGGFSRKDGGSRSGSKGFFGRSRSTKSYDGRRVKEDYA